MKIFLAWPFEMYITPEDGLVHKDVRSTLSEIKKLLVGLGHEVHNAHEREGWGKSLMAPEECTKIDFDEISASDVLLVNPGNPPSGGAHIEMGWASALGKPVVMMLEEGNSYSSLVRGLHTVADVTYLRYSSAADLMEKLRKQFSEKP